MARTFKNFKLSNEETEPEPIQPEFWGSEVPEPDHPDYPAWEKSQQAHAGYLRKLVERKRKRHREYQEQQELENEIGAEGQEASTKKRKEEMRSRKEAWVEHFVQRHGVYPGMGGNGDPSLLDDRTLDRAANLKSFVGYHPSGSELELPEGSEFGENGRWKLPDPRTMSLTQMSNLFEEINRHLSSQSEHQHINPYYHVEQDEDQDEGRQLVENKTTSEGKTILVPNPHKQPRAFPTLQSFLESGDPPELYQATGGRFFRDGENINWKRRVSLALQKYGKAFWEELPRDKRLQEGWDIMDFPAGYRDEDGNYITDTCYPRENGLDYIIHDSQNGATSLKHYVRMWRDNYLPAGTGLVQGGLTSIEKTPKLYGDPEAPEFDKGCIADPKFEEKLKSNYEQRVRGRDVEAAAKSQKGRVVIDPSLIPDPHTASEAEHQHFRKNVLGIPDEMSDEHFLENVPTYIERDQNSDNYAWPLTGADRGEKTLYIPSSRSSHPSTFPSYNKHIKKFRKLAGKERTPFYEIGLPSGTSQLDIDNEIRDRAYRDYTEIRTDERPDSNKQLDYIFEDKSGNRYSYQDYLSHRNGKCRESFLKPPLMITDPEKNSTEHVSNAISTLLQPESRDGMQDFMQHYPESGGNLLKALTLHFSTKVGRPFIVDFDSLGDLYDHKVNLKKSSGDITSELTSLGDVIERHLRAKRAEEFPTKDQESFYKKPSDISYSELDRLVRQQTGGLHDLNSFKQAVTDGNNSVHFPIDINNSGLILPLRHSDPRRHNFYTPASSDTVATRSLADYVKSTGILDSEDWGMDDQLVPSELLAGKNLRIRTRNFRRSRGNMSASRFVPEPDLYEIGRSSEGSAVDRAKRLLGSLGLSKASRDRRNAARSTTGTPNSVPLMDTPEGEVVVGQRVLVGPDRNSRGEIVSHRPNTNLALDGYARCAKCLQPSLSSHLQNGEHFGQYLTECGSAKYSLNG